MNFIPPPSPPLPPKCPKCEEPEDIRQVCAHCGYEYKDDSGMTLMGFIAGTVIVGIIIYVILTIFHWAVLTDDTFIEVLKSQWTFIKDLMGRIV